MLSQGCVRQNAGLLNMNHGYSLVVVPLLAWMATVSLVLVAYLMSLTLAERRNNRRMHEERERLGLNF